MRIVEADQPAAVAIMQRQGIAQTMWPFRRRPRALDLEFPPIVLRKVMDAAIEREQELKCVLVGNGVSRPDSIVS
jgi:hypothetical protein